MYFATFSYHYMCMPKIWIVCDIFWNCPGCWIHKPRRITLSSDKRTDDKLLIKTCLLWFCFQTLKTTSIICREIRTKYSTKHTKKNQWRFMYNTSCSLQKKHSQKWSERLTFLWGHLMTSCDISEFALCVDFLSRMASHDVLNWYRDTGHELWIFWFSRSPFSLYMYFVVLFQK